MAYSHQKLMLCVINLLAHGATVAEILNKYKDLIPEDIQACILFATRFMENITFKPLTM